MIGDHSTKPLQFAVFCKYQAMIMNIDESDMDVDLAWEQELISSIPHECVGNYVAVVSVTQLLVICGKVYRLGC